MGWVPAARFPWQQEHAVDELVLSQEDTPQSHHTTRQIARETGMHHSSVFELSDKICDWSALKNAKHRHSKCTSHDSLESDSCRVSFHRAQSTSFSSQTRKFSRLLHLLTYIYAAKGVKKRDFPAKRLLRMRPTFSKSLMLSVAVSKLGCTELIFVKPGAKVDGAFWTFTITLVVRVDYLYQVFSILKPFSWSYNKKFRGPVFLKHSVVLRGDSAVARWTCDLHVAG